MLYFRTKGSLQPSEKVAYVPSFFYFVSEMFHIISDLILFSSLIFQRINFLLLFSIPGIRIKETWSFRILSANQHQQTAHSADVTYIFDPVPFPLFNPLSRRLPCNL